MIVDLFQISAWLQLHCSLLLKLRISGCRLRHGDQSPAGLPHSLPSPNRSHYPKLCCDQRNQGKDWTKAMTDGCFSAFCRRRSVFDSWMHTDIQTQKKLANFKLSCSVNSFTPRRMFILLKNSESVFISTAINANNKPLPNLHQSATEQKASTLLNVFAGFMRLCSAARHLS